jgi:hypothetical protein
MKGSAAVRTPTKEREARVYWVESKPIYFSGHTKEGRRKQGRFYNNIAHILMSFYSTPRRRSFLDALGITYEAQYL